MARKHLRRHQLTGLVTQQPYHDLQLALLAVAVIAINCRLILLTLQVAAGNVIPKQFGLAIASPGGKEPSFDLLLLMTQPSQVLIQIVLVEPATHPQHVTGRVCLSQTNRG